MKSCKNLSPVQQSEDEVSYFPLQNSNNTVLLDSKEEEEMEASDEIEAVHGDEETTHAENTRVLDVPAQEETVSYPPLIIFDDALPCNEKEEEDELNLTNPACYDTDTDIADFDEFIHVGRRRWDVVGYDLDPIYDTENHLQLLPLQLSQQILLITNGNKEMMFLLVAFKTPRMTYYLIFQMIFSLTLRCLMSTLLSIWTLLMKMIANHRYAQILIQVKTSFA
jgi:hypothetical protein